MEARPVDHPRSRGVYANDQLRWKGHLGSSPLARGLLLLDRPDRLSRRIIPARAGFTSSDEERKRESWDHPRSRGVYPVTIIDGIVRSGSSPLARGLPCPAGGQLRELLDHPRSRGVYSSRRSARSPAPGSSPLARGLHLESVPRAGAQRIIPARAGFTRRRRAAPGRRPDHPRSRGVYYW